MTPLSHINAVVIAGGIAAAGIGLTEPILGFVTFAVALWHAENFERKGRSK